jgi:hypothetical protein
MGPEMRAATYTLVSTATKSKQGEAANFFQNLEVQEQSLRDLVTQRGWNFMRDFWQAGEGIPRSPVR